MSKGYLALVLIIIVGIAFLLNMNGWHNGTAEIETITTGSADDGVEIAIKPMGFSDGKMSFSVTANTHSIDLSGYDMHEATDLEYEEKTIKPVSFPRFTGHHSSGTVAFETKEDLKDFKIIISSIPNIDNRVFEWNRK